MKNKISEKIIFDNGYRKIISKDFDLGNGKISNYLISAISDKSKATMIFPLTKNKEVIYIKEFRQGIEDYIYCFPVGGLDIGLFGEENSLKELQEETGYIGESAIFLGKTITANYEDLIIQYYFTDNIEFNVGQKLEQGEDIEVFTSSLKEFEEKIKNGFINCPLTITCFTLAKLNGFI